MAQAQTSNAANTNGVGPADNAAPAVSAPPFRFDVKTTETLRARLSEGALDSLADKYMIRYTLSKLPRSLLAFAHVDVANNYHQYPAILDSIVQLKLVDASALAKHVMPARSFNRVECNCSGRSALIDVFVQDTFVSGSRLRTCFVNSFAYTPWKNTGACINILADLPWSELRHDPYLMELYRSILEGITSSNVTIQAIVDRLHHVNKQFATSATPWDCFCTLEAEAHHTVYTDAGAPARCHWNTILCNRYAGGTDVDSTNPFKIYVKPRMLPLNMRSEADDIFEQMGVYVQSTIRILLRMRKERNESQQASDTTQHIRNMSMYRDEMNMANDQIKLYWDKLCTTTLSHWASMQHVVSDGATTMSDQETDMFIDALLDFDGDDDPQSSTGAASSSRSATSAIATQSSFRLVDSEDLCESVLKDLRFRAGMHPSRSNCVSNLDVYFCVHNLEHSSVHPADLYMETKKSLESRYDDEIQIANDVYEMCTSKKELKNMKADIDERCDIDCFFALRTLRATCKAFRDHPLLSDTCSRLVGKFKFLELQNVKQGRGVSLKYNLPGSMRRGEEVTLTHCTQESFEFQLSTRMNAALLRRYAESMPNQNTFHPRNMLALTPEVLYEYMMPDGSLQFSAPTDSQGVAMNKDIRNDKKQGMHNVISLRKLCSAPHDVRTWYERQSQRSKGRWSIGTVSFTCPKIRTPCWSVFTNGETYANKSANIKHRVPSGRVCVVVRPFYYNNDSRKILDLKDPSEYAAARVDMLANFKVPIGRVDAILDKLSQICGDPNAQCQSPCFTVRSSKPRPCKKQRVSASEQSSSDTIELPYATFKTVHCLSDLKID